MKYYVIDRCVYAPCDGIDFETMATDTIDGDVWELYCTHSEAYKIENGKFVKLISQEELQAQLIRKEREKECFPIINRGALWYNKLSEEQKQELSQWYEAWLDAPATNVVPDRPLWIDDKL